MQENFLKQVAKVFSSSERLGLLSDTSDYLSHITFVFPNRRSGIFFRKYLSEAIDKTIFAPKIVTISELFSSLSSSILADDITLLYRLWQSWSISGSEESLDDFFYWGDILLSDFSDVDQYLVDASQLFTNLKDLNEIKSDFSWMTPLQIDATERITGIKNFWKKILSATDSNSLSQVQEESFRDKFIRLWGSLYDVYISFRNNLRKDNLAYKAMQYRDVAEAIIASKSNRPIEDYQCRILESLDAIESAVFIGFSAPTNAERVLMRYFRDRSNDSPISGLRSGCFYWDFFSDMLRSPSNRASLLISSCVDEFPSYPKLDGGDLQIPEFKLYPVSGEQQQTMVASTILSNLYNPDRDPIESALIVSDEKLLLPVLSSIPEQYTQDRDGSGVNITMGYKLRSTPLYSLIQLVISLHTSIKKRGDSYLIKTNSLIDFLSHPYISQIASVDYLLELIRSNNNFYLELNLLDDIEALAIELDSEGAINLSEEVKHLLRLLKPNDSMLLALSNEPENNSLFEDTVGYHILLFGYISELLGGIEKNYLFTYLDFLNSINQIKLSIKRSRTVYTIINQGLNNLSIAFRGEPLQGLQIMGPLESRSLDFKNVIFLSFNEGIFPANGEQRSCIPHFLRKSFGIPTYENNDSISAYNFYRLIQRAENVYMIYDTNNQAVKLKEESRFIKQLEYDFRVPLNRVNVEFSYQADSLQNQNIFPKESSKERLRDFSYSASSLNLLFKCPQQFYLKHILGDYQDTPLDDNVDASAFGNIFHGTIQKIYEDIRNESGELFTKDILLKKKRELGNRDYLYSYIDRVFADKMSIKSVEGENLVFREIVAHYILMTIDADIKRISDGDVERPFRYIEGEKRIKQTIRGVTFKAFLDRIDSTDNQVLISDYKTGSISKYISSEKYNKLSTEDKLERLFSVGARRSKADDVLFQLFLYAYLFYISEKDNPLYDMSQGVDLAIYYLKKIASEGLLRYRITIDEITQFAERLHSVMDELICSDGYFEPVKNDGCKYCDYNKFCCNRSYGERE